jgi:heme/copper-type cytochrome/quinol oxidase subunit 3
MSAATTPPGAPPPERLTIDVSQLPTVAFGHRNVSWWGTIGFMVIEGSTLAAAAAALLYLRGNFETWPPRPVLPPDLGIPTIVLVLLLAKLVPAWLGVRAAKRIDRSGTQRWLAVALVIGIAAAGFRLLEFQSLNVRWDTNAYGSIVWTTLGLHTSLLLFDVLETATLLLLLRDDERLRLKHYGDVEDGCVYEYFLSLSWVPLFLLLYVLPRA